MSTVLNDGAAIGEQLLERVTIDGQGVPDDITNRNAEMQAQARSYYWNVVTDLTITLKAVK